RPDEVSPVPSGRIPRARHGGEKRGGGRAQGPDRPRLLGAALGGRPPGCEPRPPTLAPRPGSVRQVRGGGRSPLRRQLPRPDLEEGQAIARGAHVDAVERAEPPNLPAPQSERTRSGAWRDVAPHVYR